MIWPSTRFPQGGDFLETKLQKKGTKLQRKGKNLQEKGLNSRKKVQNSHDESFVHTKLKFYTKNFYIGKIAYQIC